MDEADYVQTIEETFIRHRGNGLVLSSMDSQLIHSWRERGVPLHIVLSAIEEVMGNHRRGNQRRQVRSLSYCVEEIEASYAEWLNGRVGTQS